MVLVFLWIGTISIMYTYKVIKSRRRGSRKVLRPLKCPIVSTNGLVGQVINGSIAQQYTPRIVPIRIGGGTVFGVAQTRNRVSRTEKRYDDRWRMVLPSS
jgi:hypothetical protein